MRLKKYIIIISSILLVSNIGLADSSNSNNTSTTSVSTTQPITQKKAQANLEIDGMDYLTNGQKSKLKEEVEAKTQESEVDTVLQTANEVNTSMQALRETITNSAEPSDEDLAETNKQTDYTNAKATADALIEDSSEELTVLNIDTAKTTLKSAYDTLIQDIKAKKLESSKLEAKKSIGRLMSLTTKQKEVLSDEVDTKANETEIQEVINKANEVNTAMEELRNEISNYPEPTDKDKADDTIKSTYETVKTKVDNMLDDTNSATVSSANISDLKTEYKSAYDKLIESIEAKKLEEKKSQAKTTISNFTSLSQAQIKTLQDEVDTKSNDTEIQNVVRKAEALNTSMAELRKLAEGQSPYEKPANFDNATTDLKDKYNTLVGQANAIINEASTTAPTSNNKTTVDIKIRDLKLALNDIKDQLNVANDIEALSNLSPSQMKTFKDELANKTNNTEIKELLANAKSLNDSMGELKKLANAEAPYEKPTEYNDVAQELKTNYETLVTEANAIIKEPDTVTPTSNDKAKVDTKIGELKEALNKIKEDINLLNSVDSLSSLSQAQIKTLKDEIKAKTTLDEVKEVVEKAKALNNKMSELDNAINKTGDYALPQNFDKLSDSIKNKYNELINKATDIKNEDASKAPTQNDIATIETLLQEIKLILKDTVSLEKYKLEVTKLYNNDMSIVDNFDKGIYISSDVSLPSTLEKLINNAANKSSVINGGVQFGLNYKLPVSFNISLGAFTEYLNNGANHISVGTNYVTDYALGFVRYRLATLKLENKDVFNHNVDFYNQGYYEFKFKNGFRVKPSMGVLVNYSTKSELDDKVVLDSRIGGAVDFGTKLSYEIDKLTLFADTQIRVLFGQDQVIRQKDVKENKEVVQHNVVDGFIKLGLNKTFNNNFYVGTTMSYDIPQAFKVKLNLGYNW